MTTAPRMASTSAVFGKLYSRAELAAMTTRQRNQYELSLKHYWDLQADKETTRNRMKLERAEGRAEGRAAERMAIAVSLLGMGMTVAQVAKATSLTEEEVREML